MSRKKKHQQIFTKTVLRRILLVIIGLVIGVILYQWNASALAGNALPMPFGYGTAVVMSGSMEPSLSVGDMVIVQEEDEYAVGDVVVFQSGNSLIIHRILSIDGDMITTRGDANNADDEPIHIRYIKGKMVLSVPFIGKILQVIKSTPGMLLILVTAILLMELSFRKNKDTDEEELDTIKEEIRELQKKLKETTKGE